MDVNNNPMEIHTRGGQERSGEDCLVVVGVHGACGGSSTAIGRGLKND